MPYRGLLEVYSVHWRHSQLPPAHWTVCSLAEDVSLALVHAPGLSCRHVTRSAHRASGYQLAAICYSWCGDINKLGFLEPSQQQRLIMYQDNNQTTKILRQQPVQHRSSLQDAQLVLHRAVVISHQRGQESCH